MEPVTNYFKGGYMYCDYYLACEDSHECPRRLTQNVLDLAEYRKQPIAKYHHKPVCFKLIPVKGGND